MKNYIFLLIFTVFFSCSERESVDLDLSSVDNIETREVINTPQFVITEAVVRKISNKEYKRELVLKYYSNEKHSAISFLDEFFLDDGTNGDQVAQDGIFTSVQNYPTSNIEFDCDKFSVSSMVGVSDNLQLTKGQIDVLKEYELTSCDGGNISSLIGGKFKIGCKIGFCGCSNSCTCYGCSTGINFGLEGCWYPYDCEFEIEIEIGW